MSVSDTFDAVVKALARLPGVGRRSAERMGMALARQPDQLLFPLVAALQDAGARLVICELCGSLTDREHQPCRLCCDVSRERDRLCVVENPEDVALIERSGSYRGRYHCLHGRLAPTQGDEPDARRLRSLLKRIDDERIQEVILAISTDMEGDLTANYLADLLVRKRVHVTRLAFGLPAGSGLAWSDPVTVARALRGRQEL